MRYLRRPYQTALYLTCLVAASSAFSADYKTSPIESFQALDGQNPLTTPTLSSTGNIFGVTPYGGSYGTYAGVIYKIDRANGFQKSTVHHFNPATDGSIPESSLTERPKTGELYGVTWQGGSGNCGTIFKINDAGSFGVVTHLAESTGCHPIGKLAIDLNGNMYGTTTSGGDHKSGTLFRVDSAGNLIVLHHFGGFIGKDLLKDGQYPMAGVAIWSDTLYGVTRTGGIYERGTLFKIETDGTKYKVIENFSEATTGSFPVGTPVIDKKKKIIYGTCQNGGQGLNAGTLWGYFMEGPKMVVLHDFGLPSDDGKEPYGELTLQSDGMLFGTTSKGGRDDVGTAFQLNTNDPVPGTYLKLTDFKIKDGQTKIGRNPYSGLMPFKKNYFLGTLQNGGDANLGAIYRLREVPAQTRQTRAAGQSTWTLEGLN